MMFDRWRMDMPRQPTTIAEVQCPSCGSPRAEDRIAWLNPSTGKVSMRHDSLDSTPAIAVFLGTTAAIVAFFYVFVDGFPTWGSVAIGGALALAVLAASAWRAVKRSSNEVRIHKYKCVVCDNTWTWRDGTPRPRYRYREQIMEEYETLFGNKTVDKEDEQ